MNNSASPEVWQETKLHENGNDEEIKGVEGEKKVEFDMEKRERWLMMTKKMHINRVRMGIKPWLAEM